MEITFLRAIKIWWSFVWRAWILSLALMIVLFPLMFWLLPIPKPGEPPAQLPGFFGKFFVIWIVMMVGMVSLHAFSIRWMLKTKWSDFKLVAVPPEDAKPTDVTSV